MMDIFRQQPEEILDYGVDLTKWIITGDSVISSIAKSSPSGLNTTVSNGTTSVPKVWVSGGVNDTEYKVTLTVITNGGRTKEFEFKIVVVEI